MQDERSDPVREKPITDGEREVVVASIRQAMLDELIAFDEIDARFEAIYAADSRAQLAMVTNDLPQLPSPVPSSAAHPISPKHRTIFGGLQGGGDTALNGNVSYRAIFGSVVVDFSGLTAVFENASVTANSVFGEVVVILPDGYQIALNARSVFGNSIHVLSAPLPGSAVIEVRVGSVFGETRVFSLSRVPEGRLRQIWKRLRRATQP